MAKETPTERVATRNVAAAENGLLPLSTQNGAKPPKKSKRPEYNYYI